MTVLLCLSHSWFWLPMALGLGQYGLIASCYVYSRNFPTHWIILPLDKIHFTHSLRKFHPSCSDTAFRHLVWCKGHIVQSMSNIHNNLLLVSLFPLNVGSELLSKQSTLQIHSVPLPGWDILFRTAQWSHKSHFVKFRGTREQQKELQFYLLLTCTCQDVHNANVSEFQEE